MGVSRPCCRECSLGSRPRDSLPASFEPHGAAARAFADRTVRTRAPTQRRRMTLFPFGCTGRALPSFP